MEKTENTHVAATDSTQEFVVIPRSKFIRLTSQFCQAQYLSILIGAIAYARNVEYSLTPKDVCDILQIEWRQFERVLIRTAPKFTLKGCNRVYSLDAMVKVAELTTRPRRLELLKTGK